MLDQPSAHLNYLFHNAKFYSCICDDNLTDTNVISLLLNKRPKYILNLFSNVDDFLYYVKSAMPAIMMDEIESNSYIEKNNNVINCIKLILVDHSEYLANLFIKADLFIKLCRSNEKIAELIAQKQPEIILDLFKEPKKYLELKKNYPLVDAVLHNYQQETNKTTKSHSRRV